MRGEVQVAARACRFIRHVRSPFRPVVFPVRPYSPSVRPFCSAVSPVRMPAPARPPVRVHHLIRVYFPAGRPVCSPVRLPRLPCQFYLPRQPGCIAFLAVSPVRAPRPEAACPARRQRAFSGCWRCYKDRRMLSIHGFSMLRTPFWLSSCASVRPICRKSVESVVMPPASISLSGVSL